MGKSTDGRARPTRRQISQWHEALSPFIKREVGDGEFNGYCPIHEGDGKPHKTPSATFNLGRGVWHCHAEHCDRQTRSQVSRLVALIKQNRSPRSEKSPRSTAEKLPNERLITKWSEGLYEEDRELYWTETRGIDPDVLEEYEVGWHASAKSKDGRLGAYTIPYRDREGRLLNVKHRWPATSEHSKTFTLCAGRPTGFLWPADQLASHWVLLVEGEPDVLRAISLDLPAVTWPTGAGGAGKAARSFAPQLEGIQVVVVADSGPAGRKAAQEIASTITPYAKSVRVLDPFPEREDDSDLSDWFDRYGDDIDRFFKLLRELPVLSPTDFEVPSHEFLFPNGTFNPARLGMAAEQVGKLRKGPGASLWRYVDGVYKLDGEEWLAGYVRTVLLENFRDGRLREVKSWCKANFDDRIPTQPSMEYINVENGLLYWQGDPPRLEAHSPDVPSIIQVGAGWNPKARCPQTMKFLKSVLPADCIDFVFEWIGYLLIPTSRRFQRALMLEGPRDTGKSTLLILIQRLLGDAAVSHHTLQSICDDRFTAADLYGKLANIYADLDARAVQNAGKFKQIVAGDKMSAERKYGQPFNFEPFARMMFSANEPPGTSDQSDAYYKRWLILSMHRQLSDGEQDPSLERHLTTPEELSGVLRKSVEGLRRLISRGRFDVPKSMREAADRYRANTDTVVAWGQECLTFDRDKRVPVKDAYESYRSWCEANNRRELGRQRFKEHVASVFPRLRLAVRDGNDTWYGAKVQTDGVKAEAHGRKAKKA